MPQYSEYYPNYEELYPGIEEHPDVLRVLRESDRKMRYMVEDLKTERFMVDQEKQSAVSLPSRETSLDQTEEQLADERVSVEEQALHSVMIQLLPVALGTLTSPEQELIRALYYEGMTERQLAQLIGVSQKTIHVRKKKALSKLRRFFK